METEHGIEKHIQVTGQNENAADLIAATTGLSKTKIKAAMQKGAVWVSRSGKQKRLRRARSLVSKGDQLSIYYSPGILDLVPPQPEMIAGNDSYSVWHKPAGMMASGSRFGDHCAIDRVVARTLDAPAFLVHRLDRFVWGVMVLAHTKSAAGHLSEQFQARTTKKIYKAVVHGCLDEPLEINQAIEGKDALSHVRPLKPGSSESLVEISIETGRKHQIRIHLSSIDHPVVGDRQYGSPDRDGIQLAAVELGFTCPETGRPVTYRLEDRHHPGALSRN